MSDDELTCGHCGRPIEPPHTAWQVWIRPKVEPGVYPYAPRRWAHSACVGPMLEAADLATDPVTPSPS